MLTLANPAGLWALLGLPAVLAIHFLQRQAVVLPISTLFLLEKTQRESASGRKFDRLMNSVPLWMQLLGVLLLTWLLAEPRYQSPKSTQRVAIVLDSSASMSVFKDTLKQKLVAALPSLQGSAAALEVTLLESSPGRPKLYAGSSAEEIAAALDRWAPRAGATDPSQALRLARSLVSREGTVIYATDTPPEAVPYDAKVISTGEKIDNVGFTGCTVEMKEGTPVFRAVIRNYSANPTSRQWHLEYPDGQSSEPKQVDLAANALVTLQAAYPAHTDRVRLVLSPDRFALDDVLPLVLPKPKALSLFTATSGAFDDLTKRLLRALEPINTAADSATADLTLLAYDPLDPQSATGNAAVFVRDDTRGGAYLKGGILAEKNALIDGLNWQSLLVRETIQLERRSSDTVILWQGTRPLIFLREEAAGAGADGQTVPGKRQLFFNFDLRLSNAAAQPAFIVLLHRFAEEIREAKIAGEALNLETGQPVRLAARTGEKAEKIRIEPINLAGKAGTVVTEDPAAVVRVEAPRDPGFMRVRQGNTELLTASVQFADTREADFSECKPAELPANPSYAAVQRNTVEDKWWRAWFLLLIVAMLISWQFTREREAARSAAASPLPS
ncbi:MAG: hypothetical protein JWO82_2043 [Akkermansiaceae bacterium]|nr:hypothetical protein [Akkermansiaceae bacterium]